MDNVEYKAFQEVIKHKQATEFIVKSKKYDDNYKILFLSAGDSFVLGYTNENDGIYEITSENSKLYLMISPPLFIG